jgi:hypothetical protein
MAMRGTIFMPGKLKRPFGADIALQQNSDEHTVSRVLSALGTNFD